MKLRSYLSRLIWVCIAPLLVLSAWFAFEELRELERRGEREAGALAGNLAASVDRQLRSRIGGALMLALSPQVKDRARWGELHELARAYQEAFGNHVVLADAEGRMLLNTRVPFGASLPNIPLVRGTAAAPTALRTLKPVVGDAFVGPVAHERMVAIAVPVIRGGRAELVMIVTLETRNFQRVLDEMAAPADWTVTLKDSKGEILARRGPEGAGGESRGAVPFVARLESADWSVSVDTADAARLGALAGPGFGLALLILLATAAALVGAGLAARRLRRSLAMLAEPRSPGAVPVASGLEEIDGIRRQLADLDREREASEARFLVTFEQAAIGLAQVALDGRWMRVNRRFCAIVGYEADELVRMTFRDISFEEDAESDRARMQSLVDGTAATASGEKRYRRKDGGTVWIRFTASMVAAPDGRPDHVIASIEDISARREAEQALRSREGQLSLFIDHAPVALAMFDREMRYLAASRRWRTDYGLGERELVGHSHYEIFPEIPEAWKGVHRRGLAGEVTRHEEDRFTRADGSVHWLRWEVRPWRDAAGAVGGIVVFSEDISAAMRTRTLLESNESMLREAQRLAEVGNWRWDILTGEWTWSAEMYRIYGLDPSAPAPTFSGERAFFEAPSWEALSAAFERCLALGEPYQLDAQLVRPDGARRWIVARGAATRDEVGRVVALHGTAHDITARKRAEQERAESEARFRTIFDLAPVASVVHDRDTGEAIAANRLALAAAGCDSAAALAAHDHWLGPPFTREDFARRCRATTPGQPQRFEWQARGADGHSIWLDIQLNAIEIDGVARVLSVASDITERRRLTEELERHRHHLEELVEQRTAALAEANRALALAQRELARRAESAEAASVAKSVFLANMSHEIRTPMNAILGFAHLLRRASLPPEQDERVAKIEAAGGHLLEIINDILDLSKIEAGKLRLECVDFPLHGVLDAVRSLVGDAARAKGIAISSGTGGLPAWLRGDPTRIRQALLNFAGNAVKFTDRGTVDIQATCEREEGDRLLARFEVRDTGMGIEADELPGLFQAFHQVDTSTTRRYGGTGLGLVIAQRLAQAMGGEAGVESRPGVGSTFWFTAWLGRGEAATAPASVQSLDAEARLRAEHAGARVLLVEDDSVNQEVAMALLAETGLQIDLAVDGREAVALAPRGYDLILMDVQMPVMDGLAATRAIRALPACDRVPILAMTANAFDDDRRRCLEAGMDDFIAKPVDPEPLYATLLHWLETGRPAPDAS